jgi:hypothetical protein
LNLFPAGEPAEKEEYKEEPIMRKILSLVLALMLIASMAVPALAEKPITIGVVYKQTGNPFFEAAVKGFEEAKGELGFEYVHNGPADSSNEGQIQIIEGYIQQGVNAIAISANDASGCVAVLQTAMEQGIYVVSWDSAVLPEGRNLNIDPSNAENIGRVQIEEIAKQIGGAGQIAILSAGATMDNQNTWIKFMQQTLEDPQYADIKAIFYIKVNPTVEGIIDSARTIGGKQVDANAVKQLVDAKLDGALRDVAASFTLMSLHQEREKFIQEVQNRLKTDLQENGLVLESVSILTLRAARQGSFGTDDVFGAQVARANAQVIQQAQRERNDIERQTEIEIKLRDTGTAKQRLALDQELALAAATQEREVRTSQASEKAQADQRVFEEFQKSEFLLKKGMLDAVVPRKELKGYIARALDFMVAPAAASATDSE